MQDARKPRPLGGVFSFVRGRTPYGAVGKATEGRSIADSRYARNQSRADALGIRFGAYHFARPDGTSYDAVREAGFFVDTANLRGRHLLPALDLEVAGGLGRSALTAWGMKWLVRVEHRLGVKPMIYTTAAFWKDKMGNTTWFAANGYRVLWIAHWRVDAPSVPASNWKGHGWTFWQVSDCGKVPGNRRLRRHRPVRRARSLRGADQEQPLGRA
jgi:lysozyme